MDCVVVTKAIEVFEGEGSPYDVDVNEKPVRVCPSVEIARKWVEATARTEFECGFAERGESLDEYFCWNRCGHMEYVVTVEHHDRGGYRKLSYKLYKLPLD